MDAPSHQNNPQQRKGKGRRKTILEKIKNEVNLQVTFSKRRAGLFKKASEIDTLCGCESAVVAFSPSQKAYSYGNPDVGTIVGKFLNHAEGCNHQIEGFNHGHDDPTMGQFNQSLHDLETQLEVEKRWKKEHEKKRQENQGRPGVKPNLDELNYQQLKELKKSVLNFKQNLETKVQNHIDQSWTEGGIGFPSGSSSSTGGPYDPNYYPKNYPTDPFFSEMTTTVIGCVDPFVPPMKDNLGLPFQYPHVASGSNPIDPQTRNIVVPPMNDNLGLPFQYPHVAGGSNPIDGTMNTNEGGENTLSPLGFAEDNTQGFTSNMGDQYGSIYNNDFHVPVPKKYPTDPFFSEMTTAIIGCVDPFAPTMNNNLGFPFQYDHVAGGSNLIDARTMNTNAVAENTFFPSRFGEDNTRGFPAN